MVRPDRHEVLPPGWRRLLLEIYIRVIDVVTIYGPSDHIPPRLLINIMDTQNFKIPICHSKREEEDIDVNTDVKFNIVCMYYI